MNEFSQIFFCGLALRARTSGENFKSIRALNTGELKLSGLTIYIQCYRTVYDSLINRLTEIRLIEFD